MSVSEIWGNLKGLAQKPNVTLASATTVEVPDAQDCFYVSGTTTVVNLKASLRPGRCIMLIGDATSDTRVFDNTAVASVADGKILSSADRTLGKSDRLLYQQNADGSWTELLFTDVA